MNITSINPNKIYRNFYSRNTNFKSIYRTVCVGGNGKEKVYEGQYSLPAQLAMTEKVLVKHSNNTMFFRDDFSWKSTPHILKSYFPDGRVNIYNFACSDGSEPYCLAMTLISELGLEEAQRFFPIYASDKDPKMIELAKSGKLRITPREDDMLESFLHNSPNKDDVSDLLIESDIKYTNNGIVHEYTISETLKNAVQFKCEDITDGLSNMEDGQKFVMARNMWPYLSADEIAEASYKLRQKVEFDTNGDINDDISVDIETNDFDSKAEPKANILMAIGEFDRYQSDIPYFLRLIGFSEISETGFEKNILKISKDATFNQDGFSDFQKVIRANYQRYALRGGIHDVFCAKLLGINK